MNALVVGAGRMGRFHQRVLSDLGFHVSTVDPRPGAAADHRRVPRHRRFGVVCVATPIPVLAETAVGFAGSCDVLFIEKPMAGTFSEGDRAARELQGQQTAVGYVERFNPRIRELAAYLEGGTVPSAVFKRWNTRPSPSLELDLRAHDIDLAFHLDVRHASFDTAADMPVKVRTVTAHLWDETVTVDLLAHHESPLHAEWRDALTLGGVCATPQDAVRVLRTLQPLEVAV